MNECVVYHKHLAGMDTSDGYIGISKNFEQRMKQHERDAYVRNSEYTVHRMMRRHEGEVETDIIFEGSINDCFDYEEEKRPTWHLGWNMAMGGGRPGSGWKPNPRWMHHSLYHSEHGTEVISATNTLTDIGKRYGFSHAGFSDVLLGLRPSSKGWEIENKQIAMRLEDRYRKPWEKDYFRKDDVVVLVHRGNESIFRRHFGIPGSMLKDLINGSQPFRYGWEMSTQAEWEATTERLEFK